MGKPVTAEVKCLDTMGLTPLQKIEIAGRVCYDSSGSIEPGTDEGFVRGILNRGHESVIEHEGLVFKTKYTDGQLMGVISHFPERCNLIFGGFSLSDDSTIVSGNFRTLRDAVRFLPTLGLNDVLTDEGFGVSLDHGHNDKWFCLGKTSELANRIVGLEDVISPEQIIMKHGTLTFHIKGVSRALTHQLVRHRLCAYSQRSQRYCGEGDFDYIVPPDIAEGSQQLVYPSEMQYFAASYNSFQKAGIKNEDARFVLPNACATEIVVTATLNQWLHMIKLRTDKHAQWEIRNLFKIIHEQICEITKLKAFTDIKFRGVRRKKDDS